MKSDIINISQEKHHSTTVTMQKSWGKKGFATIKKIVPVLDQLFSQGTTTAKNSKTAQKADIIKIYQITVRIQKNWGKNLQLLRKLYRPWIPYLARERQPLKV